MAYDKLLKIIVEFLRDLNLLDEDDLEDMAEELIDRLEDAGMLR